MCKYSDDFEVRPEDEDTIDYPDIPYGYSIFADESCEMRLADLLDDVSELLKACSDDLVPAVSDLVAAVKVVAGKENITSEEFDILSGRYWDLIGDASDGD